MKDENRAASFISHPLSFIPMEIVLKKVKVHNLKSVDLELTTNELIVFTGVSGSGKSSLAFDTIFVEGQRRYIESLSTYARRYLGDLAKPDVEHVSGLSPTISIEQKTAGKNPRSTVGTLTEIYDYLRVLYARVGINYCPVSGERVTPQSKEKILRSIETLPKGTKAMILAPYAKDKKGEFKDDFDLLQKRGFTRVRLDGKFIDLSEEVSLDKNVTHDVEIVVDRITISPENFTRLAEAVTSGLEIGKGTLVVADLTSGEERLYSQHAYSPQSGLSYGPLEPHDYSFNSPSGMCPKCHGLGRTEEFDLSLVIDPEKSIAEDCCIIASSYQTVRYGNIYDNLASLYRFSVHTPWKDLSEKAKEVFLYGTEKKWVLMHFTHPSRPQSWSDYVQWRGVIYEAKHRYAEATSDGYRKKMEQLMRQQTCPLCLGSRLKSYPAATQLGGKTIHALTAMTAQEMQIFFSSLSLSPTDLMIAKELIKSIQTRLHFLNDVGLHYLTLDRTAPTLSGGEAQRVLLASSVGCGLVGVTYVLDEPSIGLHPRDNKKLLETLRNLRDMGNTVIVVEHDEETILSADRIVDFGPRAGKEGGEILVNGTLKELIDNPRSLTGAYISGKESIEIPHKKRTSKKALQLLGATHHNLKNIDVSFPLGMFIAVTGVSGSGKSSLITETLYPALLNILHHGDREVGAFDKLVGVEAIDKVIAIDQSPIGRNPRSNPSTYIKLFDEIRNLFAELPESKARGYLPGRFSFNVKEGACPECRGMGSVKIDMDFVEDAWVTCPVCKSQRFDKETLSILYKGKNIHDVLEMTAQEALLFFENIPPLRRKLEVLVEVGMGYITLGQPATTLSGGEAQRIKLAKELVRPPSGKTFYILDEPTTGLHFHDVRFLLNLLQALVDKGNTVLAIEHHMDVVKTADWVIDLGENGGAEGGKLMGAGAPEKIAILPTPTGRALKEVLEKKVLSLKAKKKGAARKGITSIAVEGAKQNNLKDLYLEIPRGKMTVCTGPSGSGKSSLAFDTVYAEGQRRYSESLSPYARQFVRPLPKPKVSQVSGLSPAIAIEQKASGGNPRSTVGTLTEVYDYLRILFAKAGTPYDPTTGEEIKKITKESIVHELLKYPEGTKMVILAPLELSKGEKFEHLVSLLQRQGYLRLRLNKEIYELDGPIPYDRRRKNQIELVIDRLKIGSATESRIAEAIEKGVAVSGKSVGVVAENEERFFNFAFSVEKTGQSFPEITPHSFSFNSPEGMCSECQGLGIQYGCHLSQKEEILFLSLKHLLSSLWNIPFMGKMQKGPLADLYRFFENEGIDPDAPLESLSAQHLALIFRGAPEGNVIKSKNSYFRWKGIEPTLERAAKLGTNEIKANLSTLLDAVTCPACQGERLNPLARHVRLKGETLPSLCALPIENALMYIDSLELDKDKSRLLSEVLSQLKKRLKFLEVVGVGYLSLNRSAPTLSNGEAQRIRLARQLGSSLTGVLYVLDEPTIGLHPHDIHRLISALQELKKLNNTLLLVEHDQKMIEMADQIFDFGPGAGIHGGEIVAEGTYSDILHHSASLTGSYFSGKKSIGQPKKPKKASRFFTISHASQHNLKNLSLSLPVGLFTCITGVSGSGKSTLLHDVIEKAVRASLQRRGRKGAVAWEGTKVVGLEAFDKLIAIDQDPIGHTIRSDVGSYSELFPLLRTFFASLPAAKTKGLENSNFSPNHRRGMCTSCYGLGFKKVEMLFLPPVSIQCEECKGARLNPLSLSIHYKEKNFGYLFGLTVEEASALFHFIPKAKRIFDTLLSVGLGYLTMGQEMSSLSGGEAQRMKLAFELSKRGTGKTLYLFDEPTTGLHADDIHKLLQVMLKLVEKGNTLIAIEHHLDFMRQADYLVDLGPTSGEKGGYLLYSGPPEGIKGHPTSLTGRYLYPV